MPPPRRLRQVFNADRPETRSRVTEIRQVLDEFPDRVLIGEAYLPPPRIVEYYGGDSPGFHLPFNFELIGTPWQARSIKAAIDRYLVELPEDAWPNWVLGNHDKSRVASRIGEAQARIAGMLQMTLGGTPFIYNGEELGLCDVSIAPDRAKDPFERLLPGYSLGRDPQRTPLPWDDALHAGFTTGEPRFPLGRGNCARNAAVQQEDSRSILCLYRQLIALRRKEAALLEGDHTPVPRRGDVVAYERHDAQKRFLIALNFGRSDQDVQIPTQGRVRLSTHLDRHDGDVVEVNAALRPDEVELGPPSKPA